MPDLTPTLDDLPELDELLERLLTSLGSGPNELPMQSRRARELFGRLMTRAVAELRERVEEAVAYDAMLDAAVAENAESAFDNKKGADMQPEDPEFGTIAAEAFRIMMRRGWTPRRYESGPPIWWVDFGPLYPMKTAPIEMDDPFTALCEADRWYRLEVEKNG